MSKLAQRFAGYRDAADMEEVRVSEDYMPHNSFSSYSTELRDSIRVILVRLHPRGSFTRGVFASVITGLTRPSSRQDNQYTRNHCY